MNTALRPSAGTNSLGLLIDGLRDEDPTRRLTSVRALQRISVAIGPDRTRREFLPFLSDLTDDDDEILVELANQLGQMVPLVGGVQYAKYLLPLLRGLICGDSRVVRSAAVTAMTTVANLLPIEDFLSEFVPMVLCLANDTRYFNVMCSACMLIPVALRRCFTYYHPSSSASGSSNAQIPTVSAGMSSNQLPQTFDPEIRKRILTITRYRILEAYSRLCKIDLPSVRRTVVEYLPQVVCACTPYELLTVIRLALPGLIADTAVNGTGIAGQDTSRCIVIAAIPVILSCINKYVFMIGASGLLCNDPQANQVTLGNNLVTCVNALKSALKRISALMVQPQCELLDPVFMTESFARADARVIVENSGLILTNGSPKPPQLQQLHGQILAHYLNSILQCIQVKPAQHAQLPEYKDYHDGQLLSRNAVSEISAVVTAHEVENLRIPPTEIFNTLLVVRNEIFRLFTNILTNHRGSSAAGPVGAVGGQNSAATLAGGQQQPSWRTRLVYSYALPYVAQTYLGALGIPQMFLKPNVLNTVIVSDHLLDLPGDQIEKCISLPAKCKCLFEGSCEECQASLRLQPGVVFSLSQQSAAALLGENSECSCLPVDNNDNASGVSNDELYANNGCDDANSNNNTLSQGGKQTCAKVEMIRSEAYYNSLAIANKQFVPLYFVPVCLAGPGDERTGDGGFKNPLSLLRCFAVSNPPPSCPISQFQQYLATIQTPAVAVCAPGNGTQETDLTPGVASYNENLITKNYLGLLEDEEPEVRSMAASRLNLMAQIVSHESAVKIIPAMLLQRCNTDESTFVRSGIARSVCMLGNIFTPEEANKYLRPLIVKLLDDKQNIVKVTVFQHISLLTTSLNINDLLQNITNCMKVLLEDVDWRVRKVVVETVASIACQIGKDAFQQRFSNVIVTWLQDTVYYIRRAAVRNIVRLTKLYGSGWLIEVVMPKLWDIIKRQGGANGASYLHLIIILILVQELLPVVEPEVRETALTQIALRLLSYQVPNVVFTSCETLGKIARLATNPDLRTTIRNAVRTYVDKNDENQDPEVRYFAQECINATKEKAQ